MRERYALGILNEGQGVALIKNAVNVDNHISDQPAVPRIDVGATLSEIDERSPIL